MSGRPAARAWRAASLIMSSVYRRASARQAGAAQVNTGKISVMTKCESRISSLGVFTMSHARWSQAMHIQGLAARITGIVALEAASNNSVRRDSSGRLVQSSTESISSSISKLSFWPVLSSGCEQYNIWPPASFVSGRVSVSLAAHPELELADICTDIDTSLLRTGRTT